MKQARYLEIGDKVNGREKGWMTVKKVEHREKIIVEYKTMFGDIVKDYWPFENVEVL